jgi:hypothetical protein
MKKTTLLLAALSVILSLTLPSCNKSDAPDALVAVEWYPIELYIYIQDKDAKDLLNYDATYYVGNDFMLTYNGKTYRMETKGTEENPELILGTDRVQQSHIAYFGTLDGDKEYDTDFILTWKDGSQDVIHFTRKINDILDTEDQWLLNGEEVEQTGNCGVITITR